MSDDLTVTVDDLHFDPVVGYIVVEIDDHTEPTPIPYHIVDTGQEVDVLKRPLEPTQDWTGVEFDDDVHTSGVFGCGTEMYHVSVEYGGVFYRLGFTHPRDGKDPRDWADYFQSYLEDGDGE